MKELNDSNFKQETNNGLVLVDFWAEWCGPCKMIAPVLEELSIEIPEITFAKFNIDQNQQIPIELGITSIPTLFLYKSGQIAEQIQGFRPKAALSSTLQKYI